MPNLSSVQPVIYLSESDVRRVLDMPIALREARRAFGSLGRRVAVDTPRMRTRQPGGHLHVLQAAAPELGLIGFKAYYNRAGAGGTSLIQLMDLQSGALLALVESDWLGRVRTGAATGVAVQALAVAADSPCTVGMFGYGRQASMQLEAVCAARPVRRARVFGRDCQALAHFCRTLSARLDVDVEPAARREDAVNDCEVVIAITRADVPVFDGAWLAPGQLVVAAGGNALDRREIDLATVRRANLIVVDSREVAEHECGDLLPAVEAGDLRWRDLAELGEVLAGKHRGRDNPGDIVLFESQGLGILDIYAAAHVLRQARENGFGTVLPMAQVPRSGALD